VSSLGGLTVHQSLRLDCQAAYTGGGLFGFSFLSCLDGRAAVAIAVECPNCGKQMRVKDDLAGRKGKCPQCQTTIQIPAAGPAMMAVGAAKGSATTETVKAPAAKTQTVAVGPDASGRAAAAVAASPALAAAGPATRASPPLSYEQMRETVLAAFNGKMTPPKVGIVRKLG